MADVREWLDGRRPEPPEGLRRRVDEALASTRAASEGRSNGTDARVLIEAGRERLETAMARPGRVRESAFELLVADALVTYACEAALESDDAVEALRRLMEVGRTR